MGIFQSHSIKDPCSVFPSHVPILTNLHWATVIQSSGWWKLSGHGTISHLRATIHSHPFGFHNLPFSKELEAEIHMFGLWSTLLDDQWEGFGFAVSNSSYQPGKGTAAWILEGRNANNWVIGECFAPSMDDDHSSFFQSKLMGIYMLLLFLKACALPEGIWKLNLQTACDGKSVLHCLWQTALTSPSEPHCDLLLGTKYLHGQCGYMVTLLHV